MPTRKHKPVLLPPDQRHLVKDAAHVASITTNPVGSKIHDALGVLWRWGGGNATDDACERASSLIAMEHQVTQQATPWGADDTERRMIAATVHAAHLTAMVAWSQAHPDTVAMVVQEAILLRDAPGNPRAAQAEVQRVRDLYRRS